MAARKSSYGKLAHMAQKVQGIDWASDASLVEADEQFARSAPLRERHHSCCHGCQNLPSEAFRQDPHSIHILFFPPYTHAVSIAQPSTFCYHLFSLFIAIIIIIMYHNVKNIS